MGHADHVSAGAGALAGGHLQAVLHATRSLGAARRRLAASRVPAAPVVLVASGEASALLEEALDADVADVLLLPQLAETSSSRSARRPFRSASRKGRAANGRVSPCSRRRAGPARPSPRRTSPLPREDDGQEDAAPRPRPAVRGRGDHARDRAGEDDSGPRHRSGRARPREARRLHDAPLVGPRRPAGADPARGRRARHRGQAGPADGGREGVVRGDRRRHVALLPRADAGDARPDRRAARSSAGSTCRRSRTSG